MIVSGKRLGDVGEYDSTKEKKDHTLGPVRKSQRTKLQAKSHVKNKLKTKNFAGNLSPKSHVRGPSGPATRTRTEEKVKPSHKFIQKNRKIIGTNRKSNNLVVNLELGRIKIEADGLQPFPKVKPEEQEDVYDFDGDKQHLNHLEFPSCLNFEGDMIDIGFKLEAENCDVHQMEDFANETTNGSDTEGPCRIEKEMDCDGEGILGLKDERLNSGLEVQFLVNEEYKLIQSYDDQPQENQLQAGMFDGDKKSQRDLLEEPQHDISDTNSHTVGNGIDLRYSMTESRNGYKCMESNRITYQPVYPGVEHAIFDDTLNCVTGILKIDPRTVKSFKMSASGRHIYWILSGEVIVRSPEDLLKQGELNYLVEKKLSSGSCLIVPCFTGHILENRSYTEEVLLGCVFVKTPDDSTRDLQSAKQ